MSELSERLVLALERIGAAHEVHAQAVAQLAVAHGQLAHAIAMASEHGIVVHAKGSCVPNDDGSEWFFETT